MKKRKSTDSAETASGPPAPRDHVAIAIDYARRCLSDKKGTFTGKLIRQAAKRFLDDLKRAECKSNAFYFDPWHAADPCDFIEKLPHVEGTWDSREIVLHASHVFFVVSLFGFRKRVDGTRRFTRALFAVARKNAKSTLAAGILLYCQCCENEPGAQVITAATTYDQAAIIFKVAKAMVERTPDLAEAFGLTAFSKSISRMEIGASFKALHAKASTQDGLNPSHVGLDEIHAHKNADLLNVLQSASGARRSPLFLFTTTEGYENPGPWGDLRRYAKQLLAGVIGGQDHFLVVYYAIDDTDEDFDERAWPKANPLWDVNEHLRTAIRNEAAEAKHMPSKLAEFRIKRLNRPSASAESHIDLLKWKKCDGAVNLDWLQGKPCTGGLDLASTGDITAFRLVWLVDGVTYTHAWRWVPANAVAQRTTRGTVPYASWVERGFIKQTEGDVVDYAIVEEDIAAACERFRPKVVGYDQWNASDIVNRLNAREIDGVEFGVFVQGTKSYHPTIQALDVAYGSGKLAHGGDPVLGWCAANLVLKTDDNLNKAPSKKRSAEKIDDMCALLMAIGAGLEPVVEEPKYQLIVM